MSIFFFVFFSPPPSLSLLSLGAFPSLSPPPPTTNTKKYALTPIGAEADRVRGTVRLVPRRENDPARVAKLVDRRPGRHVGPRPPPVARQPRAQRVRGRVEVRPRVPHGHDHARGRGVRVEGRAAAWAVVPRGGAVQVEGAARVGGGGAGGRVGGGGGGAAGAGGVGEVPRRGEVFPLAAAFFFFFFSRGVKKMKREERERERERVSLGQFFFSSFSRAPTIEKNGRGPPPKKKEKISKTTVPTTTATHR